MRFTTSMLATAMLFAGSFANENDTESESGWLSRNSALNRLTDKFVSRFAKDEDDEDDHEDFLSSYGVSVPHESDYLDIDDAPRHRKGKGRGHGKRKSKGNYGGYSKAKSYSEFGYGGYDDHDPGHEDYDGVKRCPITGKILSNLYGDGESKSGHGKKTKIGRCPVTGKLIYEDDDDDDHKHGSKEIGRCPVTGRLFSKKSFHKDDDDNKHHGGSKKIGRCPVTGKLIFEDDDEDGDHKVKRCPITGKLIHDDHDEDNHKGSDLSSKLDGFPEFH